MSVLLIPGLGWNLLYPSAALANGAETTISSFPALTAKEEVFPLRANHSIYVLGATLQELPSRYGNVGGTVQCLCCDIVAQAISMLKS